MWCLLFGNNSTKNLEHISHSSMQANAYFQFTNYHQKMPSKSMTFASYVYLNASKCKIAENYILFERTPKQTFLMCEKGVGLLFFAVCYISFYRPRNLVFLTCT